MTALDQELDPTTLAPSPVVLERTPAGDAARLEAEGLSLLQYPATTAASGPAGLSLRVHEADGAMRAHRLHGPACGGRISEDGAVHTRHGDLAARTRVAVTEDGAGWTWQVTLHNAGSTPLRLDVLHTLDVALSPLEDVRRNEQYVAQYLDLTPVVLGEDPGTLALAVRQNMPGARTPWAVVGSDDPIDSWATDALQLIDRTTGAGLDLARDLPSERLQHEHTLAALRTAPLDLAPGEERTVSFWGAVLPDHPDATGPADAPVIRALRGALELPERVPESAEPTEVPGSLLALAPEAEALPLQEPALTALAGGELRLAERDGDRLLSAFGPAGHLVTAAKERLVLRPHGHIQQRSASAAPDLAVLASTVWMRGVFCSQLTCGHASAAPLTGIRRSYLGLDPVGGVRILRRDPDGTWRRLGLPSAWLTDTADSTWVYRLAEATIEVRSRVELPGTVHLDVRTTGTPGDLLVSLDADPALEVRAEADGAALPLGDDAALFTDGAAHGTGLRSVLAPAARELHLQLGAPAETAEPAGEHPAGYTPRLPGLTRLDGTRRTGGLGDPVAVVGESLGWFAQNAAVHFRSPRGLEQFTGGAWGVRDVCQGPVGLLLATGEHQVLRATLLRVLAAQQVDGTWPQWFDYLPGHGGPGLRDSHGDVVYWPLRALGEYLQVTGDASLLDEPAGWVGEDALGEPTPVLDHVDRALAHISAQRTADPRLPAYGHGDWNDSLQPARPELARHLCSAWTAGLEIASLGALVEGLETVGRGELPLADRSRELAAGAREAVAEVLLVDEELAGYAVLDGGPLRHLVHPRDEETGLRHGSLQMIHAIADEQLTPEQARHHLELLEEHLVGPSGLHLFDRPVSYHGGVTEVFLRAEAATFWGREVGLMYMHAHLRWIEALLHLGEAEQAWQELLKAVPIGISDRLRGARPRQATAYFSSADAVFPDRWSADEHAARMFDPATGFEGGWRVYSSGPGLLLRLVVEEMLGVRVRATGIEIDPVLAAELDDTEARIPLPEGEATVRYRVGGAGCGLRSLRVDGREIPLDGSDASVVPLARRYRAAGVRLPRELVRDGSLLEVEVG